MSDAVLVNGDDVLVSDDYPDARDASSAKRFIGMDGDEFVTTCICPTLDYQSWKYAVKVPAIEYIPFTLDTLPQRHIMVREKGGNHWRDISARSTTGVLVGTVWYEYKDLLEGREMSLSFGDTWQPAGELV